MNAHFYLSQVQKYDRIIKNKLEEKEQWLAMATNISARMGGERVQSSGSQQRMADAVVESVDIGERITSAINAMMAKRNEIIETIEELNVQSYEILYMMYVGRVVAKKDGSYVTEYLTAKEIASEWCKSEGHIRYLHKVAIAELQKILDEREKAVN